MLIDMHAHSAGISKCCKIDGENMLLVSKAKGINGVVLTNHYDKSYITVDEKELAKRYVDEFYYVKECGIKHDMKVFFGIEVTMAKHNNVHMLIYGVDCDFLLKYPNIYEYEQKDLYELVKQYGGILVQAHPLRKGKNVLLNLDYLDGVEINCHPLYVGSHLGCLSDLAISNKLILTCGGDFHNDTRRVKCGVYFPDELNDIKDVVSYLNDTKSIELCIEEPDSEKTYNYTYKKEL